VPDFTVSDNFHELNEAGLKFLLIDLDVALTFMDLAQTSDSEETTRRNHHNARKAYDTVLRISERLVPDAGHQQALDAKLAVLKTRLQSAGQQF
jgi:hypothetical protein